MALDGDLPLKCSGLRCVHPLDGAGSEPNEIDQQVEELILTMKLVLVAVSVPMFLRLAAAISSCVRDGEVSMTVPDIPADDPRRDGFALDGTCPVHLTVQQNIRNLATGIENLLFDFLTSSSVCPKPDPDACVPEEPVAPRPREHPSSILAAITPYIPVECPAPPKKKIKKHRVVDPTTCSCICSDPDSVISPESARKAMGTDAQPEETDPHTGADPGRGCQSLRLVFKKSD